MDDKSEVARIKREIEQDYQAAQQGMHGLAQGTSQHQFITVRMQRMGELHERLEGLVGKEEAAKILTEAMERKKDGKES